MSAVTYREAVIRALADELAADERVDPDRRGRRAPPAASSRPPRACTSGSAGRARPRHAHLGAGDRRLRARRGGDGAAPGRRDHVRRLRRRLLRPDRQPAREVPLPVRRAGDRPRHAAHGLGGGSIGFGAQHSQCGRELVPQRPRAQARRARDAGRRLRAAACGDPRRQPGHRLRAQGALRAARASSPSAATALVELGRADVVRAGTGRHRRRHPADAPARARGRRAAGAGGDRVRGRSTLARSRRSTSTRSSRASPTPVGWPACGSRRRPGAGGRPSSATSSSRPSSTSTPRPS